METTPDLFLYGSDGCHLCEQAAHLLQTLQIPYQYRDIIDQDAWLEAYRIRIPVLASSQGDELNWPFDAQDIQQFCANLTK